MPDIALTSSRPAGSIEAVHPVQFRPAPAANTVSAAASDRVELSDLARYMSLLREVPPIREDLVAEVRSQIAAGGYDTSERLERAIDNLQLEEGDLLA